MVVMSTSSSKLPKLIKQLKHDYPTFSFQIGVSERWSPRSATITFNPVQSTRALAYGVLHELAHALLQHHTYKTDFELVKLEAKAWQLAAEIGKKYGFKISGDHIQNCLDTYRDWLHGRSNCPRCGLQGLQKNSYSYKCPNCQNVWFVTSGHLARPYRRRQATKKHPA